MKILFTGFTSRTIGSDRNVYDYMSNVFVLQRALELAGHDVDVRAVSLQNDPCIEEEYDCAVVGIAACQGLSSRFKLGALWTLARFGTRAGIFPSDGKNIYVFPGSVRTCLTGDHYDGDKKLDPVDYFLGYLQREKNNILDHELGSQPAFKEMWREALTRLPHSETNPECAWPMLVPVHSWGNVNIYGRHFGAVATGWDPTNVAIPMQFGPNDLGSDDRLPFAFNPCNSANPPAPEVPWAPRERAWVVSSLQDQSGWLKKTGAKWPIKIVGNKRKAAKGEAIAYVPERQMIDTFYRDNWGHLAFGYPLADGGWWRMRYIHAALAGIVTCCDPNDARKMPLAYQHSRIMIERYGDEKLAELALEQHQQLMKASWTADEAIQRVDNFVRSLA